jgi:iron complex outermembrane receptor protein
MKYVLSLIFLFLFLNITLAQTTFFKGQVISNNGLIVPFATINIFKSDKANKSIITKISSDDGSFILSSDTLNGNYTIRITHLSYEPFNQEIDFKTQDDKIHIFTLTEKVQTLQDVTITARTPLIYRKKDKVIMDIQNNPLADVQNIFDLLQMAPGVFVMNKQITLNGVSGTRIYINGKPLRLSGTQQQNYLNGLQAKDIKSIEIMAHPSAEDDAEGLGGIINIVLKKPTLIGTIGEIGHDQSFGLGKYPIYNPNASLNFKRNNLQISAGYSYLDQKEFCDITQERSLANNGSQSQTDNQIQKTKENDANITATYDISNKQNISFYYFGSLSKYNATTFGQTVNSYSDIINNSYSKGNFPSVTNNNFHNPGFNYEWITDTLKSKLLIIGDYSYSKTDASSLINSATYNAANQLTSDTLCNYLFPNVSTIYTLEAKYKKVYKSGTELTFGGKIALTDINTDNSFEIFQNNLWNKAPEQDFNYRYKENISATFIDLSGKVFSTDYRLGIRAEDSYVHGSLNAFAQETIHTQSYLNFFPSVFIGKRIDAKGNHYLSLSYHKRINRPGYALLNPYKYYSNNNSISSGNPYLQPAFTDEVELGYTLRSKYYFGLTYTHIKNKIERTSEINSSSLIINYIPQNIGSSINYKFLISVPFQLTKWWRTNNSLILQYIKTTAPEFSIQRGTFSIQSSNEFTLGKSTSMTLAMNYNLRTIYGNTITQPYSNVGIGVNQKLFKNKIILKALVWDLFYQNNPRMTSYYKNTEIIIDRKYQTRVLILSAIYNFKLGKMFKAKEIEKSNEDEQNRLH